jgi:hypothetical protein
LSKALPCAIPVAPADVFFEHFCPEANLDDVASSGSPPPRDVEEAAK